MVFLGPIIFSKLKQVALGLFLLTFTGCTTPADNGLYDESVFVEFTEMHCRSRVLKTQRFALADSLKRNPQYLANPDSVKTELARESRLLADSIRQKLDVLTSDMTLEEKRTFNDSLQHRIAAIGCK